jgi:hypothetical protein
VFHICFLMLSIALSFYMAPLPQALIWRLHEHLCKITAPSSKALKKNNLRR